MIEVVNVRNSSYDHYIGRTQGKYGKTCLGNPFEIPKDGNREQVIAKYRDWLWDKMQEKNSLQSIELEKLAEIARNKDIKLGCHCAPLTCHGDVVRKALGWINKERDLF